MTDRLKPAEGTLGMANHASRRAWVFYGRIVTQAAESETVLPRTLGYVLAHEVGHLILPAYSHASDGLMGPLVPDRVRDVPLFVPAQAAMLRTVLSATQDAAILVLSHAGICVCVTVKRIAAFPGSTPEHRQLEPSDQLAGSD